MKKLGMLLVLVPVLMFGQSAQVSDTRALDITKDILFAFVLIGAFFSRLLRYRKKWNDGKEG